MFYENDSVTNDLIIESIMKTNSNTNIQYVRDGSSTYSNIDTSIN